MLDHLSLQCADVDAAVSFYLRVFAACDVREAMRFDHPEGTVVGLSGPADPLLGWVDDAGNVPAREGEPWPS